jgi:dethiobiotin synthetase
MRGVFVTGTDTGVGKTVLAAAICAALAARGERVAALKPVITGLDEEPGEWPPDHELLAASASADQTPDDVALYPFGPPASPHLAAELGGASIEPAAIVAAARQAARGADALVVEGVGGLLVPLTPAYLVRDLAAELALPVVIAARPGLGTINHTLLTLEAARGAGLAVAGVVLTPWPEQPSAVEHSNLATLAELAGALLSTLPPTAPRASALARAGAELPLERWLAPIAPATIPIATDRTAA